MTIFDGLKKIWRYLPKRRRFQISVLLFLMTFSGLFELVSIGAVIPFIDVLLTPEKVLNYWYIQDLFASLNISARSDIIGFVTGLFIGAVVFSALLRGLLLWLSLRISYVIGGNFENEVFRRVLYQPYESHVRQNTSDVIAGVQKATAVTGSIFATLAILQGTVLLVSVMLAVLLVDVQVSLSVFFSIAVVYLMLMYFSRVRVKQNGEIVARNSNVQIRMMQESLGGIRDILLEGRQEQYSSYLRQVVFRVKWAAASNLMIGQSPRLFIEPFAIVVIAVIATTLSLNGQLAEQIPVFAALAYASQRVLPAAQNIFSNWSSLNAVNPALSDVFELLDKPLDDALFMGPIAPLEFQKQVKFDSVKFKYQGTQEDVLYGVSFEIQKGTSFGVAGKTGSGKSTILDLLLGLLSPSGGRILIDGVEMSGEILQRWQRTVAYVPQDPFFADASIAQNVAFGLPENEIDINRVRQALMRAQLSEMIESLPGGIESVIGEHGGKLSGGQRQRIGVARALYKQSSVLILDEATSALDVWTERALIDEILKENVTLIIVTHRLQTLEHCESVNILENGRLVASGTYSEVQESGRLPRFSAQVFQGQ